MLLEVNNLTRQFAGPDGTVTALGGVSLSVEAGELLLLDGPSGAGKTTLLLTAAGLLRPTSGSVLLDGQDPFAMSPEHRSALRGQKVGMVFQQYHLIPYLSVLQNVETALLAGDMDDAHGRAGEVIEMLGLADRANHLPAKLSSGERQRTIVARAILRRPKLLLADEPTGNLDPDNAHIVLNCLKSFADDRGAVILVSHDQLARPYITRSVYIRAGRLGENQEPTQ